MFARRCLKPLLATNEQSQTRRCYSDAVILNSNEWRNRRTGPLDGSVSHPFEVMKIHMDLYFFRIKNSSN